MSALENNGAGEAGGLLNVHETRPDARYGASLAELAAALDVLLADEDLTSAKLEAASEGLLPALADALAQRGSYRPSTTCKFCGTTRAVDPSRSFLVVDFEPIVAGRLPNGLYACSGCGPGAAAIAALRP